MVSLEKKRSEGVRQGNGAGEYRKYGEAKYREQDTEEEEKQEERW